MGVTGDWTYEKAWSEPKKVTIVYEEPIDKNDIAKGSKEAQAEYEDHQWSEVYTKYQTYEYIDEDQMPRTQMLATQKKRVQHLTMVAVCANFFKWQLEAPMRGDRQPGKIQNKKIIREEITEYKYAKGKSGFTLKEEKTEGWITGYELLGSLPVKDFRAFKKPGALASQLEKGYQSSEVIKQMSATDVFKTGSFDSENQKAKRVYSRTYTKVSSMYAFTQEGQQYLDQVLSKENGAKGSDANSNVPSFSSEYWRSKHSWRVAQEMTADGSSMNSSIGQLQLEEMPNDRVQINQPA